MEMEKQMFNQQIFAEPSREGGTQRNFNQQILLGFSQSTHVVHTTVFFDDSSLPGTALATFFFFFFFFYF